MMRSSEDGEERGREMKVSPGSLFLVTLLLILAEVATCMHICLVSIGGGEDSPLRRFVQVFLVSRVWVVSR